MNHPITSARRDSWVVPADMLGNWQRLITSVADVVGVPAGLVTRALAPDEPAGSDRIRMEVCSSQARNPFVQGSVEHLDGMSCERVLNGNGALAVANAAASGGPSPNPDVNLGLVAYLGYPVSWPDGSLFGTICVLDDQPNLFDADSRLLLSVARDAIEADLSTIDVAATAAREAGRDNSGVPGSGDGIRGMDRSESVSWDLEVDRQIVRLSRPAAAYFGLSPRRTALMRQEWFALFGPESEPMLTQMLEGLAATPGEPHTVSAVVATGPNQSTRVSLTARGVTDSRDRLRWVIGTQVRAEQDKRSIAGPHAFRNPPAKATPRLVIDAHGYIVLVSREFADLLHDEPESLVGQSLADLLAAGDALTLFWHSVRGALYEHVIEQVYHCRPTGTEPPQSVQISSLVENDRIIGAEITLTVPNPSPEPRLAGVAIQPGVDITGDAARLADGRPNPVFLEIRIDQMRVDFALTGQRHSLLVVEIHDLDIRADLDGYDVTEWMVRTVAGIAQEWATGHVVVDIAFGKVGIAGWGLGPAEAAELAAQIMTRAITEIRTPCRLSTGIVVVESLSQTTDQLLRLALASSATASELDPPICVYAPSNDVANRLYERATVARSVRAALDDDRLILYGQPIIPIGNSTEISGEAFEVLVRMMDKTGALVAAAEFIPAAEGFGLIREVDLLVLRKALFALAQAPTHVSFNINLSAHSLGRADLWNHAGELIDRAQIDPGRITFEITETALMTGAAAAGSFVEQARLAGCKIALDDFGTGMSSFTYLSQFGVDYLKIDRAFVEPCTEPGPARMLVESMSDIAHRLGARSVAEGIETNEQLAVVTDLGVDLAQGYLLGRPAPLPTLFQLE